MLKRTGEHMEKYPLKPHWVFTEWLSGYISCLLWCGFFFPLLHCDVQWGNLRIPALSNRLITWSLTALKETHYLWSTAKRPFVNGCLPQGNRVFSYNTTHSTRWQGRLFFWACSKHKAISKCWMFPFTSPQRIFYLFSDSVVLLNEKNWARKLLNQKSILFIWIFFLFP